MINEGILFLLNTYYWGIQYVANWKFDVIIVATLLLFSILLCVSSSRCKYRILDNSLIVYEELFFIKLIDVSIPISNITDVLMSRDFNHWHKHILLKIGERQYHLNATTHKSELYNELKERVERKEIRVPKKFFYKQQMN